MEPVDIEANTAETVIYRRDGKTHILPRGIWLTRHSPSRPQSLCPTADFPSRTLAAVPPCVRSPSG